MCRAVRLKAQQGMAGLSDLAVPALVVAWKQHVGRGSWEEKAQDRDFCGLNPKP